MTDRSEEAAVDEIGGDPVRGVCALGASAGGLDPLVDFLSAVPHDLGVAYLIVQHLSPDHESVMVRILERQTSMTVRRMTNDCVVEPDTVYVLGPGEVAALRGQTISIVDRVPSTIDPFQHRPIDVMFSSIASWGERAVAAVLSGTGTDGTDGLAEVHNAGGLALAQDDSAQFDGMPASAERSGMVDARASAGALAAMTVRYFTDGTRPDRDQVLLTDVEAEILHAVERSTGINFEDYKRATVRRRLDHRLLALGLSTHSDLLDRLRTTPEEADALAHDILIGVTSFFRDLNIFDQLQREVLPTLVRGAAEHRLPVRVWSVGCATGQEAYSLAMLLVEVRDEVSPATPVKIFATDVHEGSLATASRGWYSEQEMTGINPERRDRFFTAEADGWRVRPELRGLLAFSRHNLLTDPPFTGIDLISCRNTLIYLNSGAQHDAFWAFGFSLRDSGILMLGESESLGAASPDYESVGAGLNRLVSNRTSLSLRRRQRSSPLAPRTISTTTRSDSPRGASPTTGTHDLLLGRHEVGAIEFDRNGRLVHVYGNASSWLHFRAGVSLDDGLALIDDVALRAAAGNLLRRLQNSESPEGHDVSLEIEGQQRILHLSGQSSTYGGRESFLLHGRVREPVPPAAADTEPIDLDPGDEATESVVRSLRSQLAEAERHLASTKAQLDEAVRHQEYSEQQLTATNEELLVSNEELQTSIEELSSTNEELRTVADENEARLRDVLALGADLEQVLNATDIGVLLLNADTTVRRFSGTCSRYFNILESDVGRPFDHIRATFDDHDLRDAVAEAHLTHQPAELLIEPSNGFDKTLRVSVLPYQRPGNEFGVSLTLVDVTTARQRERDLSALFERLSESLRVSHIALWEGTRGVDEIWASDNFAEVSGVPVAQWDDFPHIERVHPDDVAVIQAQVDRSMEALVAGQPFPPMSYDYRIRDDADVYRTINVRVSAFRRDGAFTTRAVLEDVTLQRMQTQRLRNLNRDLEDFTNLAAHDLRAPLRGVRSLLSFLRDDHAETMVEPALDLLGRTERRVEAMQQMLDDLLEYARAGHEPDRIQQFDLRAWLADICGDAAGDSPISVAVTATADMVQTERALLGTCVRNLVDNAVKHHPGPEGVVEVTAQRASDSIVITVADDGKGIPEADQERIFRPFQRLGLVGSGIGLATVRKIVADRNGTIDLTSKEGEGASFTVVWPMDSPEAIAEGAVLPVGTGPTDR